MPTLMLSWRAFALALALIVPLLSMTSPATPPTMPLARLLAWIPALAIPNFVTSVSVLAGTPAEAALHADSGRIDRQRGIDRRRVGGVDLDVHAERACGSRGGDGAGVLGEGTRAITADHADRGRTGRRVRIAVGAFDQVVFDVDAGDFGPGIARQKSAVADRVGAAITTYPDCFGFHGRGCDHRVATLHRQRDRHGAGG